MQHIDVEDFYYGSLTLYSLVRHTHTCTNKCHLRSGKRNFPKCATLLSFCIQFVPSSSRRRRLAAGDLLSREFIISDNNNIYDYFRFRPVQHRRHVAF